MGRQSGNGMSRERLVLLAGAVSLLALLLTAVGTLVFGSGGNSNPFAGPTATATPTISQWDSQATNDTYFDVIKYPLRYVGQAITWTCNVANPFEQDTGDGRTNFGCWEYTGTYDGLSGDGEIVLSIPSSVGSGNLRIGDDLIVRGVIAGWFDGSHPPRRADPGPIVSVWSLVANGHDPNAT
jgi:hypothetical protein